MKKYFWVLAALLAPFLQDFTNAQNVISDSQWTAVVKLLESEKWPAAEKMTSALLKKIKPTQDSSYAAANLRFMYLVSVAAQLAHKNIDKETALKKVASLQGKTIVTPDREFRRKGMFNYFTLNDDSTKLSCCQSNNSATEIQIFETYQMRNPTIVAHPDLLEGKSLRIKAVIKKINAEGFAMPRLEVQFGDAYFYTD